MLIIWKGIENFDTVNRPLALLVWKGLQKAYIIDSSIEYLGCGQLGTVLAV